MRFPSWSLFVTIWMLLCASDALATPTIVVGSHNLLPNQSGQALQIFVTGGDAVSGLNLNVQIADGGSATPGHPTIGPIISNADTITGTIFASNNDGADDPGSYPQLAIRTLLTNSGTVPASGLLATITLDTTNVFSGTYALQLKNTLNGPTDFAGLAATITDGSITVPEPAFISVIGAATLLILPRRRARTLPRMP